MTCSAASLDHAPVSVIPKPFTMQQIGGVLSLYFEDVEKDVAYAQALIRQGRFVPGRRLLPKCLSSAFLPFCYLLVKLPMNRSKLPDQLAIVFSGPVSLKNQRPVTTSPPTAASIRYPWRGGALDIMPAE